MRTNRNPGTPRTKARAQPTQAEQADKEVQTNIAERLRELEHENAFLKAELSKPKRNAARAKEAAQALKEAGEVLALAMQTGVAGIWETDLQTGDNIWHKGMANLVGVPDQAAEQESKRWTEYIHPEDRERVLASFTAACHGGRSWTEEFRIVRTDGSVRWLHSRGTVVSSGASRKMIGIDTDITARKEVEDALRLSEERYRQLFENMNEAFSVVEPVYDGHGHPIDWRFLDANPAHAKITGLPLTKVIGHLNSELYPGAEPIWIETVARVAETGEPATVEAFHELSGRWFACRYYSPRPHVTAMIASDVTERKQMEEELRKNEEAARAIFDATTESVLLVDLNDTVLAVNHTTAGRLRHRAEDIIGRNIYDFLPAEVRETRKSYSQKAIAERKQVRFEDRRSDRWMDSCVCPVFDDKGNVTRLAIFSNDITERKQMEEELRQSRDQLEVRIMERTTELEREKKRFYEVLEKLPVRVCLLTPDYHIPFANRTYREAFDGEIRGRFCYDYSFGHTEPCSFCESLRPLVTGEPHYWQCTTPDGKSIIDAYDFPFTDVDGSPMVLKMSIDVTSQKQLEEQLRQAHKMEAVGTLAGGIAHDFNNMLAVIVGNAELALDEMEDEGARRNLQQILSASKRSRDLIKQILTFSRKDGSRGKVVRIVPVIKETYELLRASLPATVAMKLKIRTDTDIAVLADPGGIQQVVINLVNNAAYAMRENGGTVTIGLSVSTRPNSPFDQDVKPGRYVKLTVEDTGTGINHEVQRRMFEPFFTTKGEGQGTGMGLAVVYGIVKDFGGTIEVESEIGKGSIFIVFLPQADDLFLREDEEQAAPFPGAGRVLFVDDEAAIVEMAGIMLERMGYCVTAVTDGAEALEVFEKSCDSFDLVITDQTMPHVTGIALARKLLAIRKDIPIILCTGYSEAVSPEKAKAIGIRGFVMKPITKKEMTQVIRRVLDKREAEGPPFES